MNLFKVIKQPSAALPIVMSFAALGLVIVHLAVAGVTHEADEGTEAHIFQILMAAQIPIIAFFAIRCLPTMPKPALAVLGLQICAALMAIAPVYLLKL